MAEPVDLPLFRSADMRRDHRVARRRRARFAACGIVAGLAAIVAPWVSPPRPSLVWNASASMKIGLYRIAPPTRLTLGTIVLVRLPAGPAMLADRRHYLPLNVPALKRIAALPGRVVCADRTMIRIEGGAIFHRRLHDAAGLPLPQWQGCRSLTAGEVLLIGTASPDSFDGRYFGPSRAADIIGVAEPLWVQP